MRAETTSHRCTHGVHTRCKPSARLSESSSHVNLAPLLARHGGPGGREPVLVQVHRQRVLAGAAENLAHREQHAAQRRVHAAVIQRIDDTAVLGDDDALLAPYVSGRAGVAGGVRALHPHAVAHVKTVCGLGHAYLGAQRLFWARAAGLRACAVPTRLSMVTSRASSSSLQPSVPAGRRGSTIQRTSLVLSWTRTSTLSGSCRSNCSASVPRGSRTMRSL